MKYLLGIDFGGGASKATLLCENGKICAVSTTEYPTYYPQPGYVEQDPRDWVRSTCENIRSVMEQSGIAPADIACIALDAATHTAVVMDEGYNIIRPSIYWTDTRSTQEVNFLKEQYGDLIQKQAMHAPGTIWTLPAGDFWMPLPATPASKTMSRTTGNVSKRSSLQRIMYAIS